MRWPWIAVTIAVCVPAMAQQLATGNLLVATAKIQDRDFSHSVILLIRYDAQSAVGLTINRPSDVPISEEYPELKGSRPILVYAGGPIAIGIRALLRSPTPPGPAPRLFGDVFAITNQPLLTKLITSHTPASVIRIYAGYAGWTAAQLQNEVVRGLWRVLPADAGVLFDPNPSTLWQRLMAVRN